MICLLRLRTSSSTLAAERYGEHCFKPSNITTVRLAPAKLSLSRCSLELQVIGRPMTCRSFGAANLE